MAVQIYLLGAAQLARSITALHVTRDLHINRLPTLHVLAIGVLYCLTRCQSTMTMLVTRLACLKEPLTYLVVSTNSMVTTVGAGLPFPWHYKHTYLVTL